MKTTKATAEQLALFKNIQTRPAIEEETQSLSGMTFFSVSLHQFSDITHLDAFLSEEDADSFAEFAHRTDKSHPDFTRGGEDRARWVVAKHVFDEKGVEDSWTTCVFEADEA